MRALVPCASDLSITERRDVRDREIPYAGLRRTKEGWVVYSTSEIAKAADAKAGEARKAEPTGVGATSR